MTIPCVPCPSCGKSVPWAPESPWRPFCSERCRLIDLGEWLDESRRLPDEGAPTDGNSLGDQVPQHWEAEPTQGFPPQSD